MPLICQTTAWPFSRAAPGRKIEKPLTMNGFGPRCLKQNWVFQLCDGLGFAPKRSTRFYQLLAAIWLGNLRPVVLGTSALGQERSFDPNFPNVRFTSKADITGSISDWNERRNTYTCT